MYMIVQEVILHGNYFKFLKKRIDFLKAELFKDLDFEADRYLIDIMDGDVQDKYFAFPHTKEKKL